MGKQSIKLNSIFFVSGVGIVAFIVLGGLIHGFKKVPLSPSRVEPLPARSARIVLPMISGPTLKSSKLSTSRIHDRHFSTQHYWQQFLQEYGPGLVAEFSSDGHFVSAHNKPGDGAPAGSDFSPEDPEKAIARARQILTSAHDLLELRKEWPLENAAARSGSISAQVYFNETHDGVQLAPVGGVKVDLGSRGELLGLYSEYASHVDITNQVTLDPEEARQKVSESAGCPISRSFD